MLIVLIVMKVLIAVVPMDTQVMVLLNVLTCRNRVHRTTCPIRGPVKRQKQFRSGQPC